MLLIKRLRKVIGSLERNEAQKTGWPQQQKTLQSGKLPPAYAVLINGMDIKLVYQVKGDEAKVHTVANQMGQMQMLWTPPKSSLSTGEKVTLDTCLPSTYVRELTVHFCIPIYTTKDSRQSTFINFFLLSRINTGCPDSDHRFDQDIGKEKGQSRRTDIESKNEDITGDFNLSGFDTGRLGSPGLSIGLPALKMVGGWPVNAGDSVSILQMTV
ncbi:unnamed protein product [Aspergillus oryzae]|nr:unnamed protein product [Aspergillus oryzae]GMF88375.1 unnamed protein product [Aspergillus oryzae]